MLIFCLLKEQKNVDVAYFIRIRVYFGQFEFYLVIGVEMYFTVYLLICDRKKRIELQDEN